MTSPFCPSCGCVIGNPELHDRWHQQLGYPTPEQEATVDYVFHNTATEVITHQGRVLPGRPSFVLEVKRDGISSTLVLLRDEEVDTLFAGKPFPDEAQIEARLATLPPERFT